MYKDYEFEEEHSISIQICELREIFNNMKSLYNEVYLNKLNQGPINGNKTAYIKYIKDLIDTKIDEIIKEYEHLHTNDIIGYNGKATNIQHIVTDIIIQSLDKYTGTQDHFQYLNIRIK